MSAAISTAFATLLTPQTWTVFLRTNWLRWLVSGVRQLELTGAHLPSRHGGSTSELFEERTRDGHPAAA